MSLLIRTLKLTLATCLAAYLASFWGLTYALSAGIIAILSVSETRKTTLKLGYKRFMSTVLALSIGAISFYFLGFNLWALAAYLLVYVPLAYRFGWDIGITPSTVLVTHLLLEESIACQLLGNELLIFLIGTLVALLANLYMPDRQEELDHYHTKVESQLKAILQRFVQFLEQGDGRNEATLIKELDWILEEALALAFLDQGDHLIHKNSYHVSYFEMRQEQNHILKDMAQDINNCQLTADEAQIMAELVQKIADQLSQENPAQELLDEIDKYLTLFRQRPLPQSRQEFETRAALLQLLRDLNKFVQIKVDFAQGNDLAVS